jgi:hypothetical protein
VFGERTEHTDPVWVGWYERSPSSWIDCMCGSSKSRTGTGALPVGMRSVASNVVILYLPPVLICPAKYKLHQFVQISYICSCARTPTRLCIPNTFDPFKMFGTTGHQIAFLTGVISDHAG